MNPVRVAELPSELACGDAESGRFGLPSVPAAHILERFAGIASQTKSEGADIYFGEKSGSGNDSVYDITWAFKGRSETEH